MIRVLLVDDHQVVLEGIDSILKNHETIKVVGKASNGKGALKFVLENAVDMVLLDINMPEMDGIQFMREIQKRRIKAKVLILTMHNNAQFTKELVELGVQGCLLKNSGMRELEAAIYAVNNGEKHFVKEVTDTLLTSLDATQAAIDKVNLTRREVEILKLVVKEMTTHEIADQLSISAYTVDTHRKNMMGKIGVKNSAGLVRFAYENGLV